MRIVRDEFSDLAVLETKQRVSIDLGVDADRKTSSPEAEEMQRMMVEAIEVARQI